MTSRTDLDSLRDARVLVTGASGFIGRHLVTALGAAGASVTGVSRQARTPERGITWAVADPLDERAASVLFERHQPEVVFHLAGIASGGRDRALVLPTLRANFESTVALLLAAAERPCRFVQMGSLEEPPQRESPAAPTSPYAAAKLAATGYCRLFAELYGVDVRMARVHMVYGTGPQDEKKLVPYVIRRLLAGEAPVLSSGTRAVDWIYAADVADGLVRLATCDAAGGRQLDLGSGELVTVRSVVERLYKLMDRAEPPSFGTQGDRPLETVRVAGVAETERVLGWRPAVSLDEGLARTVSWFRANP